MQFLLYLPSTNLLRNEKHLVTEVFLLLTKSQSTAVNIVRLLILVLSNSCPVSSDSASSQHVVHASKDTPSHAAASLTPRKATLLSKLSYAQRSLARARVALFRARKSAVCVGIDRQSSLSCSCSLCTDLRKLSGVQQSFIKSQVSASKCSKYGMRYSAKEKSLALGLYYRSPSAYRFMSKMVHMPSERTLQSHVGGLYGCTLVVASNRIVWKR